MDDETGESKATLVGCPGCAGVLSMVPHDEGLADYRCQVGHAYGLSDLLTAKERQLEHALWSAMALLEHVETIIDLALDRADAMGVAAGRVSLERRREQARAHVSLLESVVQQTRVPILWP
jgi:two-component system chemotaxis response regulator CheB